MLANYHTHTTRCNHASGSDREYIEAAIKGGLRVLGFADHCPWVFPDDFISGCRMISPLIDDYFASLLPLRKEYERDITIYIGFESEYIPELMAAQDELLGRYPLDYMIIGEHFIAREPESAYTGFPTDSEHDLETYVDLIIEGLESGRYKYVAHPDLLHYTGDPEIYSSHMTRLCRYCREHEVPLEINMLGAVGKRHYPCDRFLRIAGEVGNRMIIGVDAHSPDRLYHKEGEEMCRNLAAHYGLEVIDYLPGLEPKI